jgi:hypothetical protein
MIPTTSGGISPLSAKHGAHEIGSAQAEEEDHKYNDHHN